MCNIQIGKCPCRKKYNNIYYMVQHWEHRDRKHRASGIPCKVMQILCIFVQNNSESITN